MEKDVTKNIVPILENMKRLIHYKRGGENVLREDPDFVMDRRLNIGPNRVEYSDSKSEVKDKEGILYRQQFECDHKGYFNNNMCLGECFDVVLFDSSSNAYNSMRGGKGFENSIFQDNKGFYILAESVNSFAGLDYNPDGEPRQRKIKVYLPKDEWFANLQGVVKNFTAYETCTDFKEKKNGKTYYLVYQLNDATKAIIGNLHDVNGEGEAYSDDPSRGWVITPFGSGETGYFRNLVPFDEVSFYETEEEGGNKALPILPQSFKEFQLEGYQDEYSKSRFDQWYDSAFGTFVFLAVNIIVGIATAGVASYFLTAARVGAWASRLIILGVEVGAEFGMAMIEAKYLWGRGKNSDATMVLIFAFFPILNELGFIKKAAGLMTRGDIEKFLADFQKNTPSFQTPGDVKSWIRGLDPKTAEFVETYLEEAAESLSKFSAKEMQDQINAGLEKILKEIVEKGTVTELAQKTAKEVFDDLPKSYASTYKLVGINIAFIAGIIGGSQFVEDSTDLRGILDSAEENARKISEMVSAEAQKDIQAIGEDIKKRIDANPGNLSFQREYVDYLILLGELDQAKSQENKNIAALIKIITIDAAVAYGLALKERRFDDAKKEQNQVVDLTGVNVFEIALKGCTDLAYTDFKIKEEACDFLLWMTTNKKDFEYTVTFEGKEPKTYNLLTCADIESNNLGIPEWYILNECGIRNAFKLYSQEYEQFRKKYKYYYQDTKKNWVETTQEEYIKYKEQKVPVKVEVDTSQTNTVTTNTTTTAVTTNTTTTPQNIVNYFCKTTSGISYPCSKEEYDKLPENMRYTN